MKMSYSGNVAVTQYMSILVISGGLSLGGMPRLRKLVRILSYVLVILLNDGSELWSIFHDELDLDGNGHLDAEELAIALSEAGKTNTILHDFLLQSFRNNHFAIHLGRLHGMSNLVTTFTFDQLSGV
jgi:hypothetical protein